MFHRLRVTEPDANRMMSWKIEVTPSPRSESLRANATLAALHRLIDFVHDAVRVAKFSPQPAENFAAVIMIMAAFRVPMSAIV